MERKGFLFYSSFYEAAKMLKKPTQRLAFYDGIIKYAFEGTEPSESDPLVNALLEMAYPVLKANRERFEKKTSKKPDTMSDTMSEKKTDIMSEKKTDIMSKKKTDIMSKKKTDTMSEKKTDTMSEKKTDTMSDIMSDKKSDIMSDIYLDNISDKDKDKEKDKDREKEKEKEKEMSGKPDTRTRFKAPSVDEVRAYAAENGYNLDAERFVDYYTSNGWKVGRNPMKDWKAAVRNWCKGENSSSKPAQAKRDPDAIELTESQRAEMKRLMAEWEAEERGCAF